MEKVPVTKAWNIIGEDEIHEDEETLVLWNKKGICSGDNVERLLVVAGTTAFQKGGSGREEDDTFKKRKNELGFMRKEDN